MQGFFAKIEAKAILKGWAKNDGTNEKVEILKQPDVKTGAW